MSQPEAPPASWYPVECEHGYDRCPTCDAGTTPAPTKTEPAPIAPVDLGDDPDGDNTPETIINMTEPGCLDPRCVLEHPHAGPSILRRPPEQS